ncbi:hypothetical protein ACAW68_08630 [Weissella confusa]|uniref:hypothetical protein n=1 Tax=Weissella confusa TaxID=1583 RepID=UPI0035A35D92
MKKKIIIVIVLIVAFAAGVFGYQTFNKGKGYEANIRNAHAALNEQDWESAKTYYQAAQKDKVSVEGRTALEQLKIAISAQKKADKHDWHEALSLYKSATAVDDAVGIVNKNIKVAMNQVKATRASIKESSISAKKAASSSKAASESLKAASVSASMASASSKAASIAASQSIAASSSKTASYASSVAAASSAAASSQAEAEKNSESQQSVDVPGDRPMDSADVAAARSQWDGLGYDVANVSAEDMQIAMNKIIDGHGALSMEQVADQMGWKKK